MLSLVEQGFRLIGDARDQKGFGNGQRVERIIASCGAFVGIIPFRGVETACAGEKPYNYFLQEMDVAARLGLPSVIVSDPGICRVDGSDAAHNVASTSDSRSPASRRFLMSPPTHRMPTLPAL